ncbi:hypothetical protein [Halomonas alkaliantarctica]|uniref:hypothetical protein n=1 Tax=Halomonas alkaliantarctica TaxID=232346 RepID=UPI002658FDD3|nr:hypothetical protein [Halomonas alkaliantarctica]
MLNGSSVSDFVVKRQKELGLANADLANALGYSNHNVITMIRSGKTRLPLDKVRPMASILDVDLAWLFRAVMSEYVPDTLAAIEQSLGAFTSQNERNLLEVWRHATDSSDPEITDELRKGFMSIMRLKEELAKP